MTDKLPASFGPMLSNLYSVKDALRRHGFVEAVRYLGDLLALIQNEIDWCYRTDPVLPYMLNTVLKLSDVVGQLTKSDSAKKSTVTDAIIEVITELVNELEKHAVDLPAEKAPDEFIDYLEKQHRIRTYFK